MTPQQNENGGEQDLSTSINQLLSTLKENTRSAQDERRSLYQKLDDLSRKQDAFPILLADLERRQQLALDGMRRDFEKMFIPRVEYDPKHQILVDKVREYDKMIADAVPARDEYVTLKAIVKQHDEALDEMKTHNEGAVARIIAIFGIIIAAASFLVTFFQHLTFHP